jgi:hypothetical protein
MQYVVYVNHPTSRATIHTVDCVKYINRKGNSTPNGYWQTNFNNPESATNFAKRTKENWRYCTFCFDSKK